jgi:hypothetical protein
MLAWQAASLQADLDPVPARRWVTDVEVAAAAAAGDTLYLGGGFRYIGLATDTGQSFVDLSTGALSEGCALRTGPQEGQRPAVVADPEGGLFMQTPPRPEQLIDGTGVFEVRPGQSYVRIDTSCRFDRSFTLGDFVPGDPDARGSSLVRDRDVIYVGGSRSDGAGGSYGRVAAFSAGSGARLGDWEFPAFSVVLLEGLAPGRLLVATVGRRGEPTALLRAGVLSLAATSFSPFPIDPVGQGLVHVAGDTVYISTAPGVPLVALDAATGAPRAGWSSPALQVHDLDVAEDRIYVAGSGLGRTGAFAISRATGTLIESFAPALAGPDGTPAGVERVARAGSRLFLRGRTVRSAGGAERYLLAAVDATTGAADPWSPRIFATTATAVDLVPNGARLYVGRALSDELIVRRHLAGVSLESGAVLAFDPSSGGTAPPIPPVTTLAVNATYLFAGTGESQIRRVALSTGLRDAWVVTVSAAGQPHGYVASLGATATTVFAGGFFTSAIGSGDPLSAARAHGLAVDVATARLTGWNPLVTSASTTPGTVPRPIEALAVEGGGVVIGGRFTTAGGQPRDGLAVLRADTGAATTPGVTMPAGHVATDLALSGGTAFFVGAAAAPIIGAADLAAGTVTLWAVPPDQPGVHPSSQLAVFDGRVFSGPEWDPATAMPIGTSAVRWLRPESVAQGLLELRDTTDGGPAALRFHRPLETTAPTAPRGLAVHYADNQAYLTWLPPVAGDVLSYVVRAGSARRQSNLADFDTGTAATAFLGAAPDGVYYVRVHARSASGLSPPSNEVVATLARYACNGPPRAVDRLSASVADSVVTLDWSVAIAANTYVIQAGTAPLRSNVIERRLGNLTRLVVTAPAGIYHVRIRGENACGMGPASQDVMVQVGELPGSPSDLRSELVGTRVTLTWSAPMTGAPVLDYVLEAGTARGATDIGTAVSVTTTFVVDGAPPGTYYVRVRARNATGPSAPTPDLVVRVP